MLSTVNLVEDWIRIRAALQRHIKAMEAGEHRSGAEELDSATVSTIARLKRAFREISDILKDYQRDSRT